MNKIETIYKTQFDISLNKLISQLIVDNKIINHENVYKLKTNIQTIVKYYDCNELLKHCNSLEELKYCIINVDNPYNHYCPICGNKIEFNKYKYNKTCRSKSCLCQILLNNNDIKDKHQYIIEHYLNGNDEFNYIQIGFIEKYGVYMNSQLKQWKTSIEQTWSTKTNEELNIRRQKTINTCRKKYGCDFSQQNEEVKNKQRKTWANKTNEELEHKNDMRKKTTLKKYGVDHIMKSSEILNDIKQRHFEENGYYHWLHAKIEHKEIYLDDNKFKKHVKNEYIKNNKTRIKKTNIDKFFNINCTNKLKELKLLKYVQMHESELENKFKKLFDKHNIKYIWRNRSIVDGQYGKSHCYELDFYLPDYNIGIEINDISNHNCMSLTNTYYMNNYHVYKTNNCKEKGIRLIHIWEWEIKNNFEKLSNWLLNELNNKKVKIYARNCKIKLVNTNDEKQFLNTYHLQNYSKSDICLGLYYNNELIEIMSFCKPRFTKKYEYELLRLCTKYNYIVIGGTQKLFKYFVNTYEPNSIISYCDYSKFTGGIYEKLGLIFDKLSRPMIIYCNYNMNTINESILNKYGIDNLLGTHYGKGTNNKELIIKEGYLPIPNCGNLIYTYKK